MYNPHTFYIPVMGTGFSIDTPIKVAHYGISSVISLVDDTLIEQVREYYCRKLGEEYQPITKDQDDYRAKRITAYLNLVDKIVRKQFHDLKNSAFEIGSEITKYFELLPSSSPLKSLYNLMQGTPDPKKKRALQDQLRESISAGRIDVNIMTKIDRTNYAKDGSVLSAEFSDAIAALRGYAKSSLQSAIIFSAGFNRRLYTYVEEFKDFYADAAGRIRKKIILKVSDYRSSLVQGKFFAKKGLWVSEFRVESGLNCGGHLFAGTGSLLGPILNEFKTKRLELITTLHKLYNSALAAKKCCTFAEPHKISFTAQGGIGTAEEDQFLKAHYELDATGWGTPFLLCPEATNVDDVTLKRLQAAGENDVAASDVSPINVPFSNLTNSLSEEHKQAMIAAGQPGSPCPKGHLNFNTEFSEKPICLASRQYQRLKLAELTSLDLTAGEKENLRKKITAKSCICHELGGSVLIKYGIAKYGEIFPAICPGPNIAYFSKIVTLKELVGHIYGEGNVMTHPARPDVFMKELSLYVDFFIMEHQELTCRKEKVSDDGHFAEFQQGLLDGLKYYQNLLNDPAGAYPGDRLKAQDMLTFHTNRFLEYLRTQKLLAV